MRLLPLCALALGLSACGEPAPVTQNNLKQVLRSAANEINANGQSMLKGRLKKAKVSARAEEELLVVRIENIPGGQRTVEPNVMRKLLRPQICQRPVERSVIDAGGRFKIELVTNIGKESPPVYIASCGGNGSGEPSAKPGGKNKVKG